MRSFFFLGPGRGHNDGFRSRADQGTSSGSVWSNAELEASKVTPARPSMDWNAIRENKKMYEELKWKGESADYVTFGFLLDHER